MCVLCRVRRASIEVCFQSCELMNHIGVMVRICSNFCQGKPSTRASSWRCVRANGADPDSDHSDGSRGHTKLPWFKCGAAHHTPQSCMSSLMRVARTLANRQAWCVWAEPKTCTTRRVDHGQSDHASTSRVQAPSGAAAAAGHTGLSMVVPQCNSTSMKDRTNDARARG